MTILVFQHDDMCRPGRLGLTLRDHGYRLDIRRLNRGDGLPPDLDGVTGVVSLGGPQNVGDDVAWMERECALIRQAQERDLPIVGVCLGAQLVAHALGGSVAKMDAPEIGFPVVDINPQGQIDTVLAGVAWSTAQFHHHAYEITELPPDSTILASSAQCNVQAFRTDARTYGFQYHFECDRPMIADLIRAYPKMLQAAGLSEIDLNKAADEKYQFFARQADRLCLNIATYLMPAGIEPSRIPV